MSKELSDKTRKLVATLYNQTISGQISWQNGDYSNSIECSIGSNYLQITQFSNEYNGDVDYVLFVKDRAGNIKDRIDDETIASKPQYTGSAASAASVTSGLIPEVKLERLYFEGRRRALGADETLDEILGDLGVKP